MTTTTHPGYKCPICGQRSALLHACEFCNTDFAALPCCKRKDGACGRIIEVRGVTYRAHRFYLLEARRAWEQQRKEVAI